MSKIYFSKDYFYTVIFYIETKVFIFDHSFEIYEVVTGYWVMILQARDTIFI